MDDADRTHRPTLTGRLSIALVAIATIAMLAGPLSVPAGAHAGADTFTIEAREDGCGSTTYCLEVTEGELSDIEAGEQIEVTFINPSDNNLDHNLNLADVSAASDDRDTSQSQADASTSDLAPGEEETLEFFVDTSYDGVYLWCSVGVHEDQGMYEEVSFGGEDGAGNDGDANESPGLGIVASVLALAGVGLVLGRRR